MTVRVWNVDTWECLYVLEGHTGTQLFFSVSLEIAKKGKSLHVIN
jgi:hypothetical protein